MEFVRKLTLCNILPCRWKELLLTYLNLHLEESYLRIVFPESKLRTTSFVINNIRSLAVVFGVILGNKCNLGSHLRLAPIRDMWAEFVGCCPTSERFFTGYSCLHRFSKTCTPKPEFDLGRKTHAQTLDEQLPTLTLRKKEVRETT